MQLLGTFLMTWTANWLFSSHNVTQIQASHMENLISICDDETVLL